MDSEFECSVYEPTVNKTVIKLSELDEEKTVFKKIILIFFF